MTIYNNNKFKNPILDKGGPRMERHRYVPVLASAAITTIVQTAGSNQRYPTQGKNDR